MGGNSYGGNALGSNLGGPRYGAGAGAMGMGMGMGGASGASNQLGGGDILSGYLGGSGAKGPSSVLKNISDLNSGNPSYSSQPTGNAAGGAGSVSRFGRLAQFGVMSNSGAPGQQQGGQGAPSAGAGFGRHKF